MTGDALLGFEYLFPSPRRIPIEAALGWFWRWNCQLIEVQRRQLGADEIRFRRSETSAGRDRELVGIVQARVEKVPLPCISRLATKAFQWVTEPSRSRCGG